jgi:Asp-tRNA(Asn)/Glu-tRNA(Gln) amidotransferase A subunit family amidase
VNQSRVCFVWLPGLIVRNSGSRSDYIEVIVPDAKAERETLEGQFVGRVDAQVGPGPPFDVNTPYPTEIAGVKFDSYIDWMKSCWYISATGNPAASVPAGFTPEGLPVGVQIVGRAKEDFSVLQLAHAFEQVTGFGKRHPAIA